jgi:signal peptidase II
MRSRITYFAVSLGLLVLDQLSKLWANQRLQNVDTIEVVPNFFRLTYARNRGVAFSLLADSKFEMKWILVAVSAAAAIGVIDYILRTPASQKLLSTSLALLLAGITGNLIDRFRLGEVIDFLDFHWYEKYTWPTFNVADSAICIGAILLAFEILREEKQSRVQTSAS